MADPDLRQRCGWSTTDPAMIAYHDDEWGLPCHDDRRLFEFLVLEGAQAGLSWSTILRKREGYRRAFADWDAERVAALTPADVDRLLADPGIVRNRMKIEAAIGNARAFLGVRAECGSFDRYVWSFTGGDVLRRPAPASLAEIPATTAESDAMSKALRKRGFRFAGSTICYAFMQSMGMVNDHVVGCFRTANG